MGLLCNLSYLIDGFRELKYNQSRMVVLKLPKQEKGADKICLPIITVLPSEPSTS